ncbi:hypothetical protein GCM10010399_88140 [Dactylosporangium fulvum]
MASGQGGVVLYWHVDDVHGMFERLLALGATEHERPQDRGSGFVTATVVDPFRQLAERHAQPALRRDPGREGLAMSDPAGCGVEQNCVY